MLRLITNKLSKWSLRSNRASATRTFKRELNETTNTDIPSSADVVIIGGGSAGCNALYQLGKRGVNAVLLDKSKLISGTTWHTAGLVWNLRGVCDVEMELLKASRVLYASLQEKTGVNPGWINNGGLLIAHSPERIAEYERLVTVCKNFGIDAYMIDPAETKKKFPLLDESAFAAAIYSPADGTIDPAMLVNALTKSATSNGCKIIENCPVTKILVEDINGHKTVRGIETPRGIIKTNVILNAAGVWSRSIAQMVGLDIPLIPMKHAYIVTEPMDVQGLPNIRDPDLSIYFRVQGGNISIGGYEPNPIILKSAPEDFSFSLYELNWDVFNTHVEAMNRLIPALTTTGIRTTVCGPESFTPDHRPIMGEDPRCTGLYYSCGYNSAGMMFGGGCGEQIALWIINGRPDKHMFTFDIRRYTTEQRKNFVWIKERSHEAYANNYDILFPHDEHLSGRNLKTDPFHDFFVKQGAVMEERQGWERPGWFLLDNKTAPVLPYDYGGYNDIPKNTNDTYADILKMERTFNFPPHDNIIREEALSCRNNVALFDLSYFGKLYICGPEASKAVDYIFASQVDRKINRTVYTCMLNEKGGVEGDCTVTGLESGTGGLVDPIFKGKSFYIVSGGMSLYHTWAHINKVIREKNFNVSVHNVTEQIGILSIQGPNSCQVLQLLVEDDLSNESFPFSTSKLVRINDELVHMFRLSFVGELGFELHIPRSSCQKVYKAVMECGKKYDMRLAGYRALYSLSCEKGYHLWGADLRSDDNPIEAGLEFVCRSNGNYLGKASVEECRTNGIKKRLVHLHINDDIPLWGMESVYRNDQLVGYLRRAEHGYTFKSSIGQAYIRLPNGQNITKEFLETGTYQIEARGKKYPAKIYLQSPFDPDNKRMLGVYTM
ncbi:sarcosine dehydrogenase, mitochondrial [Pseudomyrmex gracilis]|uniref:sarcosine dehydrogenase, mitochondrial n=1 Tax=Pseudomyrmex gracilis TaxID=219809 RepID=UPI000995DE1F|nr:sarcosine dehydrogenase, mitochondrial [Pseudomyrmex gracilis]XP_020288906.1 sarcosine dehydrogenase, mitochondrial [Pseudomyrmex gracilis]